MGCSNPHPHCQIWACSFLPNEPAIKEINLKNYYKKYGRALLDDYVGKEVNRRERIVIENKDWLVVVPYWAAWPFETMLISRNKLKRLDEVDEKQKTSLAIVLKQLTTKYDNLFKCSFPYSMGFHGKTESLSHYLILIPMIFMKISFISGAPTGPTAKNEDNSHWTLHALYYPPLLRSATVRKFMVGFELLCQTQRDLTAEQAADRLRQMDQDAHYSQAN